MCGSGTLLIEAGMRASDMAPGLIDPNFAFLRHPDFDAQRWEELLAAAKKRINIPKRLIIRGSDANPDAVNAARRNVEKAGLSDLIQVVVAEIHDFRPKPGWGATIVSNPPYGKRLEDEQMLLTLYNEMGKIFRERCGGYAVHLFVTSGNLARAFQLKPEKYWPFIHGGIPVRLYQYLMNSST
jgi:putative N6-adenine-specific DNA methylase